MVVQLSENVVEVNYCVGNATRIGDFINDSLREMSGVKMLDNFDTKEHFAVSSTKCQDFCNDIVKGLSEAIVVIKNTEMGLPVMQTGVVRKAQRASEDSYSVALTIAPQYLFEIKEY